MVDAFARHGHRTLQLHRVRVAKVQTLQAFGHHHRMLAVGGEVQVVGVLDRDRRARHAGRWVDRGERIAEVAVDPQRLQVPRRHHVLRLGGDREGADDGAGRWVDDVDGVAHAVRYVDEVRVAADRRAQQVRPVEAIDVAGVDDRRHPGQGARGGARDGGHLPRCGRGRRHRHRRHRAGGGLPGAARLGAGGHHHQRGRGNRTAGSRPHPDRDLHRVGPSRVDVVTAASPRERSPSRMTGRAATVPACPRCRLTTAPGRAAASTLSEIAAAPGSL